MKWWSESLEDLLLQPFTGSPDSSVLLNWWAMVHPVWPVFVLHSSRQVVLWWMLEIYIETESLDFFFFCFNENWKTCLLTLNLNNKGFYCCSLSWLLSYFIFIRLCFGVYLQELNVLLVWAGWGFCNQFLQFLFRDLHSRPTIQWFLWGLCKPRKQNSSVLTLDPCKNGTHGKQYMRLGY